MKNFKRLCFSSGVAVSLVVSGCMPTLWPEQHYQYANNLTVDNYTAFSHLNLMGTTVKNTLRVNGSLRASNAALNHVYTNGSAVIENTLIQGDLNTNGATDLSKVSVMENFIASGNLSMKDTWIKKPMVAYSPKIKLKNSWIGDLHVRGSKYYTTTVELQKGSQVKGNIIFEKGQGQVFIDPSSKVHGSILGAKVEEDVIAVNVNKVKTNIDHEKQLSQEQ